MLSTMHAAIITRVAIGCDDKLSVVQRQKSAADNGGIVVGWL